MSVRSKPEPGVRFDGGEMRRDWPTLRPGAHIHLVGVGGAGLSAIARVLLERGYRVSGSDLAPGRFSTPLVELGAAIYAGHAATQVTGADLVLASSAIPTGNIELSEARRQGIPVVKRPEFLGWLTAGHQTIAVAGTHGKTTTTAMIAWVLSEAGHDPSYIIGGVLPELRGNAHAGEGPHFVIEADEYDRTFLGLNPAMAVITNVEWDHVDCYPVPGDCAMAFRSFADRVHADGLLVVSAEDLIAADIGKSRRALGAPVVSYGLAADSDWQARRLRPNSRGGSDYTAWRKGRRLGTISLQIPGQHNVLNSLAALAVADGLGIPFAETTSALSGVSGAERRFQCKGTSWGVTVVDDYAHHPTEIRATLSAARERFAGHSVWAVFQPHTYSRTKALLHEFASSFADADHVIVTAIYAARERDTLGISAVELSEGLAHADARYIGGLEEAADFLLQRLVPGDVLITMGAGDGFKVGEHVLAGLRGRD